MRNAALSVLFFAVGCGSFGIDPTKLVDTGVEGLSGDGGDGVGGGNGAGNDGSGEEDSVSITSLTPNWAGLDGGTSVSIRGTGFEGDVDFYFGAAEVSVTVISNTELVVSSPLVRGEGTVDVTVVSDFGESTLVDAFTFTSDPTGGDDGGTGADDGGGSDDGGSGTGGSGTGGSGGSGSGGGSGTGAAGFSGTYAFVSGFGYYAGDYDCIAIFNATGSATSGCPGCDFAFTMNFTYDYGRSYDPYLSCSSSSFSASLGFDSDYYGGRGAAMLLYGSSWVPLTDNTTYNASSGYWGFGSGYLDYPYTYWYSTYYYSSYDVVYGYTF